MLLKVSDGDGGWVLFDKVGQVHLRSKDHVVKDITELNALGNGSSLNLIAKECFIKNESVSVGIIEFEKDGTLRTALFTHIVFICNDSGDTLDKLSVDRKRR